MGANPILFSRITASRRMNMSFKDMLGQGSDTEDADCDIEECLEELGGRTRSSFPEITNRRPREE